MRNMVSSFSGFSVKDQAQAKEFYSNLLGLEVEEDGMGLTLKLPGGNVFVYTKADHQPATYTIVNFVVQDINAAVDELAAKGITMVRYDNMPVAQDEKGILRGKSANQGPDIAWFTDPSGNILAVLED